MALVILLLFGALDGSMTIDEWIGKVAIQTVPASIGALLAQSQLGRTAEEQQKRRDSGDFGEYFFMFAGAVFLAANVAPTEEVVLISYMMSTWQVIGLSVLSLTLMHAFVYSVEFSGQHDRPQGVSGFSLFVRFSVVGYVMALAVSAYVCWSFGRFEGLSLEEMLQATMVLGFPAAVGAAAARLVL
jgi:putative integral membrane protein (TIGR02587 family)